MNLSMESGIKNPSNITSAATPRSSGLACWFPLAVILLLALLLRTVPLTYSHFWDEAVFLQNAKVITESRTNYDEFDYRPPVLSLLYALGFKIWDHLYVANLVQGVVTTLAVLFAFLYVKQSFGPIPALFSAFLLSFTPYIVSASHDLLTDMPAVAFLLAAMWLFDKPGVRFAFLSGVVSALAVQTRFTSMFVFVYFALVAILPPRKMRSLAFLSVGALAAIAPYLLWVQWNYGNFLHPFDHGRRMVTEWSAPVPSGFYWDGLLKIFPSSMWLMFGLGILIPLVRGVAQHRTGESGRLSAGFFEMGAQPKRQLVLLIWGVAFLVYMLSIPHKEVRYLLPLAIPVVVIGGLGLAEFFRWFARQASPVRVAGLLLGIAMGVLEYASPFHQLAQPWVDRSEWETVKIARYVQQVSTSIDTIYAAHEFPVLAFYSERRTVSLLPIQANFDQVWRRFMTQPGFLVYFHPAGIKETHSINPLFKPDQSFLESTPNFRIVRVFPLATVYRYEPAW